MDLTLIHILYVPVKFVYGFVKSTTLHVSFYEELSKNEEETFCQLHSDVHSSFICFVVPFVS